MPAPTIDYLNARRAAMPASGGAKQIRAVKYAPDAQGRKCLDGLNYLAVWVARRRERSAALLAADDEIVF